MHVLGIDPGQYQSSFVIWDGQCIGESHTAPNMDMRYHIGAFKNGPVAIERIVPHGMATPMSAIETVEWIGRFIECCYQHEAILIPRTTIRKHICFNGNARDTNIIHALKDRFGEPPTKKCSNPIYGMFKPKGDEWQAWAVAVTCYDQMAMEKEQDG